MVFHTSKDVLCLVTQLCPTLLDPIVCSLPGSSVQGIAQARILEWVAISSSRGSSQPKDRTQVSCTAGGPFTIWATREVTSKDRACPDAWNNCGHLRQWDKAAYCPSTPCCPVTTWKPHLGLGQSFKDLPWSSMLPTMTHPPQSKLIRLSMKPSPCSHSTHSCLCFSLFY